MLILFFLFYAQQTNITFSVSSDEIYCNGFTGSLQKLHANPIYYYRCEGGLLEEWLNCKSDSTTLLKDG
jgi:hypothetical protein